MSDNNQDRAWCEQPDIPTLAESYVEDSILSIQVDEGTRVKSRPKAIEEIDTLIKLQTESRDKSRAALAAWDRAVKSHRECQASIANDPHVYELYFSALVEWFSELYDACGYVEGSHGPDCIAFGL